MRKKTHQNAQNVGTTDKPDAGPTGHQGTAMHANVPCENVIDEQHGIGMHASALFGNAIDEQLDIALHNGVRINEEQDGEHGEQDEQNNINRNLVK